MKKFSSLFYELDQTNKTNEKIEIIKKYFKKTSDPDKVWAVALFTGRRPKSPFNRSLLKQWATEFAEIPFWLFEESYIRVGDLAETITLLLPQQNKTQNKTLTFYINHLKEISTLEDEKKKETLFDLWDSMNKTERFAFNKLITGGFRVGVSRRLLVRALSELYEIDDAKIMHRIMGNWSPENISFQKLILEENPDEDTSKPYPFFLAYPIEDYPSKLGKPLDWQAEWKWDGIRSQFIKRKDRFYIWSRGEEIVTEKFPEFNELSDSLPNGTVIDGELLAYKDGKPLEFSVLQKRIGRKNITKKILEEAPVSLIAYDLMEFDKKDIRKINLKDRRKELAKLVKRINFPNFIFSKTVSFKRWDELENKKSEARKNSAEGFMIKKLESEYGVGRKKGDWWKWKVDPYTVDAVMIYAQRGHGRRASLYTDYTFAVWDKDKLVPIAKAYSGLSNKEISEVDSFIRKNTIEKFGPVRSVEPELVFEIAFENIQRSTRHKSGVAVRFPRISKWRHDKKPKEADNLKSLYSLLENKN